MLPLLIASLVLIALAIGIVIGVFYRIKTTPWPYLKKEYLLTQAERNFYLVLSEAIGLDYLLFTKVRMADLLYLPKMENSSFYRYQNKIQSKHVDFLLCEKDSIKPLLAIELDDSSHLKVDRVLRDAFVDKAFENAKLPILHIRVASTYHSDDLLKQVRNALHTYEPTISTPSSVQ